MVAVLAPHAPPAMVMIARLVDVPIVTQVSTEIPSVSIGRADVEMDSGEPAASVLFAAKEIG